MSNPYPTGPQKITIGAGTCIKIGFFAAFGALLFSLVVSVVLAIIGLVAGIAFLPFLQKLLNGG